MVSLLGLVVLLFLLIQLPFVQRRITTEIEKIAQSTLGSDVGIGNISLQFPSRITIDDVYVNNPAGDTIARVGHLGVGINMYALIRSTVDISEVEIDDVYAKVITTDSSSNIQFLLDALMPVDTVAMDNSPQADSVATSSGGFVINLDGASLRLNRADIYYQDDPAGILADVTANKLAAEINEADLNAMRFDIDYVDLSGADVAVRIGESSTPVDTTAEAAPLELIAGRLTISESAFRMGMDSLDLATELPYVNLEGAKLVMGDSLAFRGELFQLNQFGFRMDTPAPALEGPGLDVNHLALTEVETEITDISYLVDSLHLRLRQLTAKEKSGLEVLRTEGVVEYDPSFLGLRDFLLRTTHSELKSDNTAINYDFASADLEQMVARAQLEGYLGLKDIALLAPELAKESIIRNNLGKRFDFAVRADGTVAEMDIQTIQLDGPGLKLRANGRATNVLDPERAGGTLTLRELSITPGPLLPLLPSGTLPAGIDWPQRIVAEGKATYNDNRLELDLYALENRVFGNGLNSRVRTSGVVNGVTTFPNTRLNVKLDTLLATRATILAYVPPGSIPEDYTLPDFVRGSGSISGPMDNLDVNLRLNLPGDSTYARINGNVRNALDTDKLALDLEVSDLGINITDVRAILPDSLLPANLNLPSLRVRNARISGSLTDLTFDVPLETDNGNWNVSGKYNPEDLNVAANITGVRVPDLFTGALRDTLLTLDLGPLDIRADVSGHLEPTMNLNVNAFVAEAGGDSLLDLTALVSDTRYEAEFDLLHPDLLASGSARYLMHADSTVFVEAIVDVERAELQTWDITEVPLAVSGSLVARSEGIDPYNLDAFVRFDDVVLRSDDGSSYVDSLLLTAAMHDWDNEIYLRSDVIDGDVVGRFDPLTTPEKLVAFLIAYWDPSLRQPDPVEDGSSLDVTLNLKRPQPLTGGLIPGLTELSPMNLSLLYRDARPEFLFKLNLPELVYSGIETRDLNMTAVGDTADLSFTADWGDVNYNEQVQLGRTVISGETEDDRLLVQLKLYTPEDSLRHYLGAYVDQQGDSLNVQLEQEQILNFETWRLPASNLITLAGPNLLIKNFDLHHGTQSLVANTTEPNHVEVTFNDFDLRTPSRLVFSEEEVAGGILNGSVELDNVMSNLGIQTDLTIDGFSWSGQVVGDLVANVSSGDEQNYNIDVALTNEGNDVAITGDYALNGGMDLLVDVNKLMLSSAEPFSLGYLQETEGYLAGQIEVTGTAAAPQLNGSVAFQDASLIISLLGERFRMGDNPITFTGERITFTNGLAIYDTEDNAATLTGNIDLNSLDNIGLDMLLVADDFTAINSTDDDNPDYYGTMSVDARVEIGGTATLPVLNVDATTNEGSDITYVYTVGSEGLVDNDGIVEFEEQYQWQDIIRRDTLIDTDSMIAQRSGIEMTINLDIKPNLQVTVVVDPATGQTFVGRAEGNLTLKINPDGSQEATGRVEVVQGRYDFIYQVINKELDIVKGSTVTFNGDIQNPILDVTVRYEVKTSSLPLVEAMNGNVTDATTLRRKQTFYVLIGLEGDLTNSDLTTNVVYPTDVYGNLGISNVTDALSTLRQDDSRMTTTAFQLLAFDAFSIPLIDQGGGDGTSLANTTLNNAVGGYLNNLANKYVGFVELDFGLDSYQAENGSTNTNLRVSLRKTLFNDRIVVSVDGVAGNAADEANGTQQTYLDNITAEYLINADGSFRLKFFNDRDRDVLVGGNVVRFGGRLTFSKEFDRLFWSPKQDQ